ncbi:glycerophosphodiester phosphodiesterase family protein [Halioglobus sp. HI00S01]|uniref:glycerophosphodiester phosphodiesterase family protein n=1 Tax=Halioglobus sp. HI00S01 TaxID=1822214 RepID=UPI0012E8AAA7|nr:glycerophosphodiester phosphodiesterase family protein [Halioglobus sp. HI00S01]
MKIHKPLSVAVALLTVAACSDSDPRPAVSASNLSVISTALPEGAPGEMPSLMFRAVLDVPQPRDVSINYSTKAESATAGDDYLDTAGEAVIRAGELEAFISVDLLGDAEEESAETFTLELSVQGNANLVDVTATGTIANDDTACDTPYSYTENPWRVFGADPLNYAHRGGVIDFPENTLFAYGEVAVVGADVLEMDVYQTADNELVVLHDLTVDRTTNGTGRVVDLTLAELKALDAAYWFVPGEGTPHDRPDDAYVFRGIATGDAPPPPGYSREDFQIPTLEEALQRFPHNLINVELKPDLDGVGDYEGQMASLLQRYGRASDVIAASFVDEAAMNFKAVAPCVHTSVPLDQGSALVLGSLGDGVIPPVPEHVAFQVPPDTSQITGSGQLPDDFFLEVVTEDFVADAHAANLAVQVWTINTCEDMLRMIAFGVDAIMTDRPVLLEELLNTPADQRSCE